MIKTSIQQLFEACSRVRDAFSPPGREFTESELIIAEAERERDFIVIINHMSAMARLLIQGKSGEILADYDRGQAGIDIITPFFIRRRNNGPFELVHVINRFFSKTVDPEPLDIYYYLRAAVRIRYSNYIRRRKRFADPEYIRTGRNLGAYISGSERFVREGSFIIDSYIEADSNNSRPPQKDDILALCGPAVSPGDSVPVIVDAIFEVLAESVEFQSRVKRDALVASIIDLQSDRSDCLMKKRLSTFDLFLQKELSDISLKVAEELRRSYSWRNPFDDDTREAILNAVEDYLLDLGLKDTQSTRRYLEPHVRCGACEYREKYKGCLQNLIKRAEKLWIEKVRCIPGLLYHIKGEFYEEQK